MSGSSGNTSAGSKGGRTPRNENEDVIARHGRGGAEPTPNPDASTAARGRRGGEGRDDDPDVPNEG